MAATIKASKQTGKKKNMDLGIVNLKLVEERDTALIQRKPCPKCGEFCPPVDKKHFYCRDCEIEFDKNESMFIITPQGKLLPCI